jgi:hypothetical protein
MGERERERERETAESSAGNRAPSSSTDEGLMVRQAHHEAAFQSYFHPARSMIFSASALFLA